MRSDDGNTRALFVCTANVCRSPMAEAIFNALAEERGVSWRAKSAGVAALVGEGISPRAGAALEEVGVFAEGHRARQVDARMLERADLVLAMTRTHADTLLRLSPQASTKVHTLMTFVGDFGEGTDIPDPYGQSMTAHRASVRQLLRYLEALVERVKVGNGM
ncbi:low molecular weight protein arginine phosphatase [Rubrobacter tropicus]|uniref:Low molecular weight protein arginine phosphatase n=1 Tax=Rubrobacter tropicus TaxID=2653851 RepID=A0A6G8QD89_9ACTN|nr:low molecular weight protein arginine phosphatase [Rubrobacter tropicus]QIN84361.1 low molecular weight protein arginine phosphatase [Rubrobacter tropicus]